jgi:hypothetical protein
VHSAGVVNGSQDGPTLDGGMQEIGGNAVVAHLFHISQYKDLLAMSVGGRVLCSTVRRNPQSEYSFDQQGCEGFLVPLYSIR